MNPSTHILDPTVSAIFLSDLHLGDGSAADLFGSQDRALISLLDQAAGEVDTIVFLGDIFDLPQGWTLRRIRAAHRELWTYLEQLCQATEVVFVRGNHDWRVPCAELFPGSACCAELQVGESVLAWHGHQLDRVLRSTARGTLFTVYLHNFCERLAGRRLVPPLERYDSTPNRVATAMTVLWGRWKMSRARVLRAVGLSGHAAELEENVRYLARSFIGDPADIYGAAERTVLGRGFDTLVCGHSHIPGLVETTRGRYVNTGSWTCGSRSYAHLADGRFQVLDAAAGRPIGDESYVDLPLESEPDELFRWWRRHHRGWLRFEW